MRIDQLVSDQAEVRPGEPALWWQRQPVSFGELHERIAAASRATVASTVRGDRVAVLSWNRPELLELLYGVPAAGRIVVPLNARLHPLELRHQLEWCGASLLLGEAELVDAVGSAVPTVRFGPEYTEWLASGRRATADADGEGEGDGDGDGDGDGEGEGEGPEHGAADDAAWIIFTSGSTGHPKGAVLTHTSLLAAVDAAAGARPVAPDDCYLYPFPLFHVSAYNVLIQHRHGRPVALLRAFDAVEVLASCAALGVTTMSLAPTMISMLLDHPSFDVAALRTVRTIGYGASAIGEPLLRRVLDETTVGLSQGYGMTELSGNACFLDAGDHRRAASSRPELLRSAGRPAPGVLLRLAPDGEILVRAPQMMQGYWNEPELTATTIVDGWLHTGDIGRIDAGYLYVVDRKKDLIVSGGENIASREVEDALGAHPGVRQVAVIGIPDPHWGEAVCAVVSRRAGAELDDVELIAHCRDRLAGYKRPRHVIFRDELPVNANGKLDKPMLRTWAADQLTAR